MSTSVIRYVVPVLVGVLLLPTSVARADDPCSCDADVDHDLLVTFTDIQRIIQCLSEPPIGPCASMDVNCDDSIDYQDVDAAICTWQGGTGCCDECACTVDVDVSGAIDFTDVQLVVSCVGEPPVGDCTRADVNCDGRINDRDIEPVICAFQGFEDCCLPRAACCLEGGVCTETTDADCTTNGGTFDRYAACDGDEQACCYIGPGGVPQCAQADVYCCVNNLLGTPLGAGTVCGDVQACCLPDASCEDTGVFCCYEQGGTPAGDGSSCAVEACTGCLCHADVDEDGNLDFTDIQRVIFCLGQEPAGQCARCDVNCDGEIDQDDIDSAVCVWQGGDDCCALIGACCTGDYACTMTTQTDCAQNLLGVFEGDDSACSESAQACIHDTDQCTMADPLCCVSGLDGVPQGAGTACGQTQACCLSNGSCDDLDTIVCISQFSGTPMGAGAACTAAFACCLPDGACADLDPLCCEQLGGTPDAGEGHCLGDANSDGIDEACPARCCEPDGSCADVSSAACDASGGTFHLGKVCLGDANSDGIDDGCCDCDADIDDSGAVDFIDISTIVGCTGQPVAGACAAADVNCDGVIDPLDIHAAVCVFEGRSYCCEPCFCDGDVNNDGEINLTDIQLIVLCAGQSAAGDCASRDVNCDGIVDQADIESGVCLFQGYDDCCEPRGACCLGSGACTVATEEDCAALGGSFDLYHLCTGDEQACCYTDGGQESCFQADATCCLQVAGGTPLGAGSMCAAVESCCLPDGSCTEADVFCCYAEGGTPLGDESMCAAGVCDGCLCHADVDADAIVNFSDVQRIAMCFGQSAVGDCERADVNCDETIDERDAYAVVCEFQGGADCCLPRGACCLPDGACMRTTYDDCVNSQLGTYHGDWTLCSPAPQGCCMPDGTCLDIDPLCCEEQGGAPMGIAAFCDAAQGCCLPDGTCSMAEPTCCAALLDGSPTGPQTMCTDTEACCLPTGACEDLDPLCCVDVGGVPRGAATVCLGDLDQDGIDDACPADGACCSNGLCTTTTLAGCGQISGLFLGVGTPCLGDANSNGQDDACCECDADVDGNQEVNFADIQLVIACLGQPAEGACADMDVNCDQVISQADIEAAVCVFEGTCDFCCRVCLCDADVDDNSVVNLSDVQYVIACLGQPATGDCYQMDVDCDCDIDTDDVDAVVCAFQGGSDCCTPTGACCLPDGSCDVVTLDECHAAGGAYHGDETNCSGSVEACCYSSGEPEEDQCIQADLLCCTIDLEGTPLGAGSTCGDQQACCLPDGGCNDLDLFCCFQQGGTPLGPGSQCEAGGAALCGTCLCFADVDENGIVNFNDVQRVIQCLGEEPSGTCHRMDVDCNGEIDEDDVNATVCRFTGGVDCCGPRGACCLGDPLGCIVTTEGDCLLREGAFQGDDTQCGGELEACCLDIGTGCVMADGVCCASELGGTPLGAGSQCLAPEACCLPDQTCVEHDPSCCAYLYGVPMGLDSACESGAPGPDPLCTPCECAADVDSNGLVNFVDIQLVILCFYQQPTGVCANMDVDCDGVIGPGDANAAVCAFQGAEDCCSGCACHGDVNANGVINFTDIQLVVQCLGVPPFGECERMDVNCDGVIDEDDIDTMICIWQGGFDCCVLEEPEGACCIGFQCSSRTEVECLGSGGVYIGDDTRCGPGTCGKGLKK